MALIVKDRVKESTTTTGTANFTLGGSAAGFQTFAIIGNTNTTYYAAVDQTTGDWEVGVGTYSTTGPTLTRDTVLESSNSGSKVVFAAGSKDVFCTYPAERSVYLDAAGSAVSILDIGTLGVSTANITTANITAGTISTAPVNNTDIVNKQYADAIASGIHFHEAVALATTAALPANTYNNGTSGVGATLTATTNGALSVDSTLTIVAERILVKNEANGSRNGVYVVTQVGSAGTPYILTRATDFDTVGTGVDQIDEGDFFLVTSGVANLNTAWVQQTAPPITVGTTAIFFQQFSAPITYTAGTGLSESPTYTFNIANTGTAGTYGSASNVPVFVTNAQGQVTSVTNTGIAISSAAVSGLAASATTDTTNAANITSGTLPSGRIAGSYTNLTGTGALAAGSLATGFTAVSAPLGGTGQTSYAVGDLLYASTTTALSKLADVAVGNALISGGVDAAPSYGKIGLTTHVSGTLAVTNGGTGATDAAGIRTAAGATTVGGNVLTLTNPSAITFPRFNADNTVSALDAANFRTAIGAGTGAGTVTSVTGTAPVVSSGGTTPAISMAAASSGVNGYMTGAYATKLDGIAAGAQPGTVTSVATSGSVSGLTLTGGTITTTGTIALGGTLSVTPSNFAVQAANTFLAAPNGSSGTPSFRTLVAADVPTLNQNTTGTSSNVTGTVAVVNGGTGQNTYTNGQLLIGNTTGNTLSKATLTQGTGITIANGAGSITVTNSAPDQTVALTGAGATSISGTYPNFTISSVNTTYSLATSTVLGLIELGSDTQQTVASNAVTATTARSYALQVNSAGQGVVNVPWTDTTYSLATSTVLGLIRLNSDTLQTTAATAVSSTANRTYGLQVNASGQGVVNVPWTDTNSGGTVTSVGLAMPTQFTVTNSPVTTSGTLTANWNSQTQNTFLAAPNGAAGVPTFRAIVAADVPTLNQNTSGNAATATNASNTSSISNAVGTTYTWTATQYFTGNGDTASSAGIGAQAYSTGGNGAIMAFHRAGVYAINMGLDSDNVFRIGGWSAGANRLQMDMSGNLTMAGTLGGTGLAGGASTGSGASGTWGINITGSAGIATALNSSNYIDRTGSSGNLNTDFSNTPAGTQRYQGDDANLTNSPGNTWWIYENKRHSNSSNVWGTQVAWGWEDNANRLATRNVQNGSFGAWVYYLNSSNFTTYAPSLTGSGASGTWGINITGNAATATTATNQSGGTVNATTAVVTPNAAGVSTGLTVVNGDITAYRTGGTTGAIYLSSSGGNYLFWDGSNYYLGGNIALSSGNYNSYAPTLTGGGASGSWGISVTGTSANVTGTVAVANGGTGATAAAGARTNLGATTLGANVFTVPNVAAIAFPRFNADNTVSTLDAASFRTAIGAGTGSGTVTSVATSGTVSGLTLTGGTITTTGTITLGGTLAVTPSNFAFQNANTFLAAPNGSGGVPTFRTVVVADIPTLNQNTTGSSGSCTGNAATATTATTATNVSGGTISNARLNPRTLTNTTASTVTPDIAVYDQYNFTALSSALTVNAPIGTPVDGNKLILRLLDNGTARALTWNTTYVAMGFTLPTTTVANKMTYVGCIYNSTNARWDVIAVATQA